MGGTVVSLNIPPSSHPTVIEGETVIEHGLLRHRSERGGGVGLTFNGLQLDPVSTF